MTPCLPAVIAVPVKDEGVTIYISESGLLCHAVQIRFKFHGKIHHTPAAPAYKMAVIAGIIIVALRAIVTVHLPYTAHLREQRKVSVNCAETDVREFPAQRLVQRVRGRMIASRHQILKNCLTLAAVRCV